MIIRITGKGIYGIDGEIPVGTEIMVKSAPLGWDGRYEIVSEDAAPEAVAVTNPAARRGRPAKVA